ncbi:hypothetical protein IWZ03DRAFT_241751 [Phyllosticta citriasiana]|uniref:Uncharacterized protein n=1 Tax=Phyllosticta citriasiana TaxID=595635 RepID=A0ABR1KHU4_9PEZI
MAMTPVRGEGNDGYRTSDGEMESGGTRAQGKVIQRSRWVASSHIVAPAEVEKPCMQGSSLLGSKRGLSTRGTLTRCQFAPCSRAHGIKPTEAPTEPLHAVMKFKSSTSRSELSSPRIRRAAEIASILRAECMSLLAVHRWQFTSFPQAKDDCLTTCNRLRDTRPIRSKAIQSGRVCNLINHWSCLVDQPHLLQYRTASTRKTARACESIEVERVPDAVKVGQAIGAREAILCGGQRPRENKATASTYERQIGTGTAIRTCIDDCVCDVDCGVEVCGWLDVKDAASNQMELVSAQKPPDI